MLSFVTRFMITFPVLFPLVCVVGNPIEAQGHVDLITQEIDETRELLRLSKERISLLKKVQNLATGSNGVSRTLLKEFPLLSELAHERAVLPSAASEDYLTATASIQLDSPANLIKFLPLRFAHQSTYALPLSILVVAQNNGTVNLLTPSGRHVTSFEAGHDMPVSLLAVSPSWSKGDMLIATGDEGGIIRIHKILARERPGKMVHPDAEPSVSVENDTAYFGVTVDWALISATFFDKQLEVYPQAGSAGERTPKLTALTMASQRGSKFFVAGDADGKITIFSIDGAFRSRLDVTSTSGAGIDGFYVHLNQLLFRAGSEFGYVELEEGVVKHVECPDFDGERITAIAIDSLQNARVFVADQEGTVWVFIVRRARQCRVQYKFPRGVAKAPIDIASVRGHVLLMERFGTTNARSKMVLLNMSIASQQYNENKRQPSPVVWNRNVGLARSWAVHRNRGKPTDLGDLIAYLTDDGMKIVVFELLMNLDIEPPAESIFMNSWLVIPTIVITVLSGGCWHYLKYGRFMVEKSKKNK